MHCNFARGDSRLSNSVRHTKVMTLSSQVLRCQDIEMLSLDLHGLLEKCPDVSEEQLVRLLALRGDVPRAHVRDTVAHVRASRQPPRAPPHPALPRLFKDITFNDRLLAHFTL
ncbi:unnamed protein product [Euphydryas editha]|uniref:Uncharacterized protein n=1 Tax=Euphydryas editha TaxID=104508 RepID=A0AAU9VDD8_EUPED|nr:unnamed protein product [Euphydryas editha]